MYLTLHKNAKDLSKRKFGRLQPLGATRHEFDKSGRKLIVWLCQCDCGKTIETRSCNLLSGDTTSCGCFKNEVIRQRNQTHGKSNTPMYKIWRLMIQRCEQPSASPYAYYGGRGIKVCDRWRNSFEAFLADMGERPSRRHSIDRIDPNGNYEPSNCRWATHFEQMKNTRRTRLLTANGETLHMQEWCRRTGINQRTLWDRLASGWSEQEALTTPPLKTWSTKPRHKR